MKQRPDLIAWSLLLSLAMVAIGLGEAFVAFGLLDAWELAALVGVGGVLIAATHPRSTATPHRNAQIHGAARPASQDETLSAARGDKTAPLHHHTFED